MSQTDEQRLELFLLRYVPHVVRDEALNFAAFLVKQSGEVLGHRFNQDWRRIQCLYPDSDVEVLQAMQAHLQNELRYTPKWNEFCRVFKNYVSNGFVLMLPKAIVTSDPAKELEIISRLYFESPHRKIEVRRTGVNAIRHEMEAKFYDAGVLELLQRHTSVAPYTNPEDTLTIDFLYHAGNTIKMFQAISVSRQTETALGFAHRCPMIAGGLQKQLKHLIMTAVVEDNLDHAEHGVAFAVRMLEDANIRVASLAEMPSIAETARADLCP